MYIYAISVEFNYSIRETLQKALPFPEYYGLGTFTVP